ncbi:uncharacterized protein PFLUO_LOCUS28 [Penicillium psychrofluorescens]|uniref:uncharacterized protein n=1 Tax=Penicillium psychrofluorescens TaxID=3158075 RepID=UPI003CCE3D66
MNSPNVLIVGATGGVGGSLLRQLLALPRPPSIRVSTRNLAKAEFPSSVQAVQGDLEDASSYPMLFRGIDRVFMYAKPEVSFPQLLSAARDCGVTYMVLLSSMTVEFDPESIVGRLHREVEHAIKASGLQYTFLRPRNFSSNSRQFWVPQMEKTGKLWMAYPNAQTAPVSEDDMAGVALVSLTTDKLLNQAVGLSGPVSISQREQVNAINRLRVSEGKKPVELIILSPEEWKARQAGHMSAEFQDQLLTWWELTDGKPEMIQSSERITGKPSQSYDDWLLLNKAGFLKF